jgi:hypothetical protein
MKKITYQSLLHVYTSPHIVHSTFHVVTGCTEHSEAQVSFYLGPMLGRFSIEESITWMVLNSQTELIEPSLTCGCQSEASVCGFMKVVFIESLCTMKNWFATIETYKGIGSLYVYLCKGIGSCQLFYNWASKI